MNAEITPAKPGRGEPTLNRAFELLAEQLQKHGQAAQRRVMAHVRARTGKNQPLPLFHKDPEFDDEFKVALYKECALAVVTGNYAKLQGELGRGDKTVNPPPPEVVVENRRTTQPITAEAPTPTPAADDEPADDLTAAMLRRLQPYLGKVAVDENRVQQIVDARFKDIKPSEPPDIDALIKHALNNGEFPVDRVKAIVQEAIASLSCLRIDISTPSGEVRSINELYHWQLPQVVTWVHAGVPVWLWSAAGAGKTHLPRQISKALDIPYYTFSVDPTTTTGKLLGFRNLSTGEFVRGWLYQPYKEGGLVLLDELDTGDPGVLAALNALLANDEYTFPDGERIKRHENFRVLVGANTKGCGAVAGYTARNRLDAATLDRFAVIEMTYDEGLERAIATGNPIKPSDKSWALAPKADAAACERWVEWVQKVRKAVGNSVLVSPRASINGARALRAGIPAQEVTDALVLRFCTDDTRRNIVNSCGAFSL